MCAQILEHNNFFSCIVFGDETRFHITGHINQHNCVIWGSEPLGEHLEHERDSLKVNVSCTLTYERVIGLLLFDDIITSNSCWKIMLFCTSTTTIVIVFFYWTVHLFILLTLPMTVWMWISQERDQLHGPLILLILHLQNFFLLGCVEDRYTVKEYIYTGLYQSTDHCSNCRCYKDMLQHVWQEVDCRWDVCRATDGTHCEVIFT
jgi:hypothetical protein